MARLVQWLDVGMVSTRAGSQLIRATGALSNKTVSGE